jgi:hypothetical protein
MNEIKAVQVKSKQCQDWIQSGKAILRNDLRPADMEGFLDYYMLDDGGLLLRNVFEKKNGILYKTYREYQELEEKNEKKKVLIDKYGSPKGASFNSYLRIKTEDFRKMIPQSAQLLERAFLLKPNSLDCSIKSLRYISKAMKKALAIMDIDEFEEKYVFLITAYCGEVIRKQIGGEWLIRGSEEGILHQVMIIDKGKPEYSYKPEIGLAKILAGDVSNRLDIEVDAQLHKYGFIKGNEEHYNVQ